MSKPNDNGRFGDPLSALLDIAKFPRRREREEFGDVKLSVQASEGHYCSPRVSGLPLDQYESVELAVVDARGELVLPSAIGVEGFDRLFEEGETPVAGYVSQEDLAALREAIKAKHAK